MSDTRDVEPEAARGRERRTRTRRRMIVRLVVAGAVAAALAQAVADVAFQDAPSAPSTAAAKMIRGDAVSPASAGILHIAVNATEISGTGARTSWSEDAWLGYPLGAPNFLHYVAGFRQILSHSGITVQTGVFGRRPYLGTEYYNLPGVRLYDPSTKTVYELPPLRNPIFCSKRVIHPTNCLPFKAPRATGCRETDVGGAVGGAPSAIVGSTRAMDRRFKANALAAGPYFGGPSTKPFFSGFDSRIPDLWAPCLSEQLAIQIHYGLAERVGTTSVDGRRVIEFKAVGGSWTYDEDARTNEPVRLVIRGFTASEWQTTPPSKREQATLTINVRTDQQLPLRGNGNLLSLTAQHPGARIDTKPADYYAAQARLFPVRSWG